MRGCKTARRASVGNKDPARGSLLGLVRPPVAMTSSRQSRGSRVAGWDRGRTGALRAAGRQPTGPVLVEAGDLVQRAAAAGSRATFSAAGVIPRKFADARSDLDGMPVSSNARPAEGGSGYTIDQRNRQAGVGAGQ